MIKAIDSEPAEDTDREEEHMTQQYKPDRRYYAGRPYFRPPNKLDVSKKDDLAFVIVLTAVVFSMLGGVVCLAFVTTGVIAV